jgi:hypothetical protein
MILLLRGNVTGSSCSALPSTYLPFLSIVVLSQIPRVSRIHLTCVTTTKSGISFPPRILGWYLDQLKMLTTLQGRGQCCMEEEASHVALLVSSTSLNVAGSSFVVGVPFEPSSLHHIQ